jgi:hypothetical protein
VTLAETWDGTSWSRQSTPNPPGAVYSFLSYVSCSAAKSCTAVGSSAGSAGMYALVEAWNGTSWSIQSTPKPKAGVFSQLLGVSCTSATECAAVGDYANSDGTSVTLVETWNGSSWSIKPSPNPTGTVGSTLYGISCSATTACAAVGYYYSNLAGATLTLAEEWNGTRWSVRPSPNPIATAESVLYGVSCLSATACIAVGSSDYSTGPYVTLAEAYSG